MRVALFPAISACVQFTVNRMELRRALRAGYRCETRGPQATPRLTACVNQASGTLHRLRLLLLLW